jgi:ankyrin repeat protein
MSIGRSCPRNQEYILLYPRSPELKEAVCEYFIVVVQLCKHVVLFLEKPLLSQLLSASQSLVRNEFDDFQHKLERLAGTIKQEIDLASARVQVQESQENSRFRNRVLASSTQSQRWRRKQTELQFLDECSLYDHRRAWRQLRKKGNVEWFVEEQSYVRWKAQAVAGVLHCTGILGSGKSVLSANVVDNLVSDQPPFRVAYFFCGYDDILSLSARTIIGSIARQILECLKPKMSEVISNVNAHNLDSEEIVDILLKILSTNSDRVENLVIVIDGIDECQESDARSALECLRRLIRSRHTIKLFSSSRLDVSPWVAEVLVPAHVLSMATSSSCDEMTLYVEGTLESALLSGRLRVGDIQIMDIIKDTLLKNAHGMYLWVAFQIETICFEQTDRGILNALEDLPRDLPETFNRILGKLRTSGEMSSSSNSPVNVFRIVAAARRPLMLEELREAVSVEPGVTAWDSRMVVNDVQKLIKSCGSLLVVDEEECTVRFTHQSVRQFLCSDLVGDEVKEFKIDLSSVDLELGTICVTYLNSERHSSQLIKPWKQKPLEQMSHLFASSATLSRTIPSSTFAGKLALKVLRKRPELKHELCSSMEGLSSLDSKSESLNQLHHAFLHYAEQNWLVHTKRLNYPLYPKIWPLWKHIATGKGHVIQLPWAPEDCFDLNAELLKWVVQHQQWNIVFMVIAHRQCLSEDVLLRLQEFNVGLSLAKTEGKILKNFLQTFTHSELEEQPPTPPSGSPLYIASSLHRVECVRLLLEYGAAIDFDNFGSGTALYAACLTCAHWGTDTSIVKLLLESGADVNVQAGIYGTALQAACAQGQEKAIRMLLGHSADVNIRGGLHGTALYAACDRTNVTLVKLLLESGADVNVHGGKYGTALQAACIAGNEEVLKLLLDNGADINIQGGGYGTALQAACARNWEAGFRLLLKRGADVNVQSAEHGTALQAACAYDRADFVRLLLQYEADVNEQGGKYGTAFQAACDNGNEGIMRLLENHEGSADTIHKYWMEEFSGTRKRT